MSQISDLKTADQWLAYYRAVGTRYLTQTPHLPTSPPQRKAALKSYLESHVATAVSLRASTLRNGLTYGSVIRGAGAAGLLPFGKVAVKHTGSALFLYQAVRAYGLEDQDRLLELLWDTAVAAKLVETRPGKIFASEAKGQLRKLVKQDARDLWGEGGLREAVQADLADEFGDEVADEAMHLLPVVGQVWSMGRGYYKAWKKLEKVLEVTEEKARAVHRDVLVFVVVEGLMPTEREVVKKTTPPSSSSTLRVEKTPPSSSSTLRVQKTPPSTYNTARTQQPLPSTPATARTHPPPAPSQSLSEALGEALATFLSQIFTGLILAISTALTALFLAVLQAILYAVATLILCVVALLAGVLLLVGVYAAFGEEAALVTLIGLFVVGGCVYGYGRARGAKTARKEE